MRLIDADALKHEIFDMCQEFDGVQMLVDEAPTIDAVPVVRCAECKHNNESRAIGESGMWCDYWGIDPDPDDFCRWGERRSDE